MNTGYCYFAAPSFYCFVGGGELNGDQGAAAGSGAYDPSCVPNNNGNPSQVQGTCIGTITVTGENNAPGSSTAVQYYDSNNNYAPVGLTCDVREHACDAGYIISVPSAAPDGSGYDIEYSACFPQYIPNESPACEPNGLTYAVAQKSGGIVIYDNLRKVVVGSNPQASPYVVGQHMSFSVLAEGSDSNTLSNVNWSVNAGGQIVTSYNFPTPAAGSNNYVWTTAVAAATATPSPASSSIAFYPVFAGNITIKAMATSDAGPTPVPVQTTVTIPVVAPTVAPTMVSVYNWSVDSNYIYQFNTPYPSPLPAGGTYIHLGGASTANSAAGIDKSFTITTIPQTTNGITLGLQTTYECDSITVSGQGTAYNGTKGPTAMIDTLDGNIDFIASNHSSPFTTGISDSPGYPVVQGTAPASASVVNSFESYIMYQYGVASDPSAANIFVPLSKALAWSWKAGAVRNGSHIWVATSNPSPGPPTVSVVAVTAEPTLTYQIPFGAKTPMTVISSCQP